MKDEMEKLQREAYEAKSEKNKLNNQFVETKRKLERTEANLKKLQSVEETLKEQNSTNMKKLTKIENRYEDKV